MRSTRALGRFAAILLAAVLALELGGITRSAFRSIQAGRRIEVSRRSLLADSSSPESPAELALRALELARDVEIERRRIYRGGDVDPARFAELVRESAASSGVAVLAVRRVGSRGEVELSVEAPTAGLIAWLDSLDRKMPDWPVSSLQLSSSGGGVSLNAVLRVGFRTGGGP